MQQWVAATVLAILPLLIAVSYATIAFQQQTSNQQALVDEMDHLANHNSGLSANVRELVRIARQYLLLQDDSFLALYKQKALALHDNVVMLEKQLSDPGNGQRLGTISTLVEEVFELLHDPDLTFDVLSTQLRLLVDYSEQLSSSISLYRQHAIRSSERDFNRIVEQLFWLTVLALPGTFLLLLVGAFMVSRPIWRLSQAIKGLGRQQWHEPIRISGPADLVALGENLEWMRQQVHASERQKTAFIQHVTHELKTPLAGIIEAGNLLIEEVPGPLCAEQKPVLDILCTNARNLQGLIDQLLNYNAVSHGIMTRSGSVDIAAMCEAIKNGLETANPDKVIAWEFRGFPHRVNSDARLVEMILKNLLGNAFQFSRSPGRITVSWGLDDHSWYLTVADEGPGIEADEIEHIFTPFYKGRTGRQDAVPKNGIGLAVVRESVNLLKGQIVVDSAQDQGAIFRLRFPVESITDSSEATRKSP